MSYEYQEPSTNCFDNLIGIKGNCGVSQVPDSGLFLQDLPHINLSVMDAAIGKEAQSAFDELERKLQLAQILVVNELRTALSSRFKINSVLDNDRVGYFKENLEVRAAQSKYIGANIKISQYPYLEILITRIAIQSQVTAIIPVFIIDLLSGNILDTILINAVAETIVYKDVFKKYKTNGQISNLYICYDDTGLPAYQTLINPSGYCPGCNGGWSGRNYTQVRGASMSLSGVTDQDIVSESNTGGLCVEYNVSCDIDRFACSIKYELSQPIWYRAGILILDDIIASKRFNSLIRLFEGDYKEAREVYQKMYDNQLKWMLNNMVMPKDICFHCNPRYSTQTVLP